MCQAGNSASRTAKGTSLSIAYWLESIFASSEILIFQNVHKESIKNIVFYWFFIDCLIDFSIDCLLIPYWSPLDLLLIFYGFLEPCMSFLKTVFHLCSFGSTQGIGWKSSGFSTVGCKRTYSWKRLLSLGKGFTVLEKALKSWERQACQREVHSTRLSHGWRWGSYTSAWKSTRSWWQT